MDRYRAANLNSWEARVPVRAASRDYDLAGDVIDAGLRVTALREHTECEWQALEHLVEGPDGKFRLPVMPERLPLVFTLEARK